MAIAAASLFFVYHLLKYFVIFSAAYIVLRWCSSDKNKLPPGPTTWPIVGNLMQFDLENPLVTFYQWAKQFGPVYRLYMGSELNIVINDHEVLRTVFSGHYGEITAARPYNYMVDNLLNGSYGIVFNQGESWKEQRRFSLSKLKDFGFGKASMEDLILRELNQMIAAVKEKIRQTPKVDIVSNLKYCAGNIIASVSFGKTLRPGDTEFHQFQEQLDEFFRLIPKSQALTFFPVLRYLCPNYFNFDKISKNFMDMRLFVRKQIAPHFDRDLLGDSDFVSVYIDEMNKKSSMSEASFFTRTQLELLMLDLFIAGQETTVTTLSWAILYLLHNPDVQTKIQAELFETVGGTPNWNDRGKLPYTNAVIAEVQRVANIIPLGVVHQNMEEIEVCGYKIPPKTTIISNLHAIHNDPRNFPNPEKFSPERFLDESGCLDKSKIDKLIPFSVGKRICLGQSLARMELFLILSALLANFTFEPIDKLSLPSLQPRFGTTLATIPFSVNLIPTNFC